MAEPINIDVDPATLMTLELQRFDKRIAEAEAQVADLKKQRAAYIFDTNIQIIVAKNRKPEIQNPAT